MMLKSLKISSLKQNIGYNFSTSVISEVEKDIKLLEELKKMMATKGSNEIGGAEGDALFCWIKDMAGDDKESAYPEGRKLIMQYSRKCFQWEPEADKKFKRRILDWSLERKKDAKSKNAE
eukprot:CAMPEP_0119033136 /NCGR_PEP_ID=MMETSP1177-20130426/134_1 /TAXON_ID=2985 /ORGANISM="Ochromonas sp, Strain CCMP1899" /LENGTH=119 /DNA_ID=CAMNT_0006989629 /DNA_START=117 /DNA_END=476 /DNA_ORIENTATION=+